LPSQTSIFAHLLLLQDALPGLLLIANGALWTISVEWRIYFLFPLLVRGWSYIGAWATTLITVGVSVALFLLLQQTELNVEMHGISPQFLGLFVMGMLAATVAFSPAPQMKPLRTQVPFFAVFGLLSVVLVVLAKVRPWTVHYTDYIVGIWASCLLIEVTTRQKGLLARFFGWKPLIWIGTFAYSLYLIHMALLRLMWQYVVFPLGLSNFPTFLVLLVGGVPLIVLAAYGFFCLAERPFLRRRATTEAQGKRPAERPPDSVPEPARNAPETHG
jgi:peptidoglycan/LPS O-acetylase OafA/YrhL